ncbi:Flp pilus assembly protein CpaB [Burkholderia sp. KK1]|uniref:Flp pilus assembly protein CpaB n=1 Tax=unclassified Caballeronia TaxID=2646786 RepID=UPI00097997E6|nr:MULTISPECIES: Flp pilus assembly protein CpaB [unclassified Caballeronia]AQH00846.1 Flp pilus assembly protein CpaB [Burkholderia sp. KK1]MCE4544109.1 Flp pilus assembly protein CpaB [Caballeronia sp. PC1]MCE4571260.1 Flp pilus assembly protein CpaB [Caballeronia sp. CLC5]BBP98824.1 fimbriae assembly protein [Burkholderia sp. SFA1]
MSNIIKFAVLLVGALLIALIVRVVVASASRPADHPVTSEKVQVSAAELPQGLLLRDEDLAWKSVPASQVPPNAIVSGAQNAVDIKGALLRHPVESGAVLTSADVILPSAPGFLAATLKPDMRAVSVAVDDVSGNAGLIQPGDYVDLLLTQQMDRRTDSPDLAVSSETVVEHVRVLAVGSEIKRPKITGDVAEAISRARTVTLEVTPRMGEVVAVAARLGSLSLALRSFATDTRGPGATAAAAAAASSAQRTPIWAGDISRAVRDLPRQRPAQAVAMARAPAPARPVAIYRGSEKSETSNIAQLGGSSDGAPPLPSVPPGR